jgi:DNA polymerase-3 subunit alpha
VEQVGESVVLAGLVSSTRIITTRKGDRMAFVKLEDLQGSVEVVVFPRTFEETKEFLVEDNILLVRGKVESRNDRMSVLADVVQLYEAQPPGAGDGEQPEGAAENGIYGESSLMEGMQHHVTLSIRRTSDAEQDKKQLAALLALLQEWPGDDRVYLRFTFEDGRVTVLEFPQLAIGWNTRLRDSLGGLGVGYEVRDVTPAPRQPYRMSA